MTMLDPPLQADLRQEPMRVAFVDSGLGLLGYAAALRALAPTSELVLSLDPDHIPYGPRPPHQVTELVLASARATLRFAPQALVVACNTASVHALDALRRELEPGIPVIGTVPAIRPAAAAGQPVAVWATRATTSSRYLAGLIAQFAADATVTPISCPGLAEAIEAGDEEAIDEAILAAAARTPADVANVVLGCTHYGLVADRIQAVLPHATLFDSTNAVARQTLRRLAEPGVAPSAAGGRPLTVLLSGRTGQLPRVAARYGAGRRLLAPSHPIAG